MEDWGADRSSNGEIGEEGSYVHKYARIEKGALIIEMESFVYVFRRAVFVQTKKKKSVGERKQLKVGILLLFIYLFIFYLGKFHATLKVANHIEIISFYNLLVICK